MVYSNGRVHFISPSARAFMGYWLSVKREDLAGLRDQLRTYDLLGMRNEADEIRERLSNLIYILILYFKYFTIL